MWRAVDKRSDADFFCLVVQKQTIVAEYGERQGEVIFCWVLNFDAGSARAECGNASLIKVRVWTDYDRILAHVKDESLVRTDVAANKSICGHVEVFHQSCEIWFRDVDIVVVDRQHCFRRVG